VHAIVVAPDQGEWHRGARIAMVRFFGPCATRADEQIPGFAAGNDERGGGWDEQTAVLHERHSERGQLIQRVIVSAVGEFRKLEHHPEQTRWLWLPAEDALEALSRRGRVRR